MMSTCNVNQFCRVFLLVVFCMANIVCFSQSEEKLLEKANKGDAEAQYRYGSYYCGKDTLLKLSWWKKAAMQGHSMASLELGWYYYRDGMYEDAAYWFEKCDIGHGWTMSARMYKNGIGVKKDLEKAVFYYEKYLNANKRDVKKNGWLYDGRSQMLGLAQCYDSLGNYGDAMKWYQEICYGKYHRHMQEMNEWDCASAIVGMIRLYYLGLGVEKDMKMVDKLLWELDLTYSKFSYKSVPNMLYYASEYMRNPSTPGDDAMVLFWIGKGIERKSADAMYMKGDVYENGRYGVSQDLEKAVELYKTAYMDYKNMNACGRLGVLCFDGVKVEGLSQYDICDARAFLVLAELGGVKDPDVAERLSYCYRDGYCTDINPELQKLWETRAREWGSKKARDWFLQDLERKKREEREQLGEKQY